MTCDCTVRCGDDPWLKDGSGRHTPCQNRLDLEQHNRLVGEQLAKITDLRKVYGAANLYELLDKMQAEVKRLQTVVVDCTDTWHGLRTELDAVRSELRKRTKEVEDFQAKVSAITDPREPGRIMSEAESQAAIQKLKAWITPKEWKS